MIYLDNAATTRTRRCAIDSMVKYAELSYFNPSSGYAPAIEVKKDLNEAATKLANIIGATKEELVFTSCATESNNWAFECGIRNKKGNIAVSAAEHASAYECAMRLKNRGADVRFVPVDKFGRVTENALLSVVDSNTSFVSIIHCSNETGSMNDIKSLSAVVKSVNPKAVFHSDGVQAFCKVHTDVRDLGVDLYSISAHKVGGCKGVGALYVKKGMNLPPLIVGGGQQDGRRSGTENVGGIIGFAEAAMEYKERARNFDVYGLRKAFLDKFKGLADVAVNGDEHNLGYVISLSFNGLRGEIIANLAEQRGVLIGLGSACSTHIKTNRVLRAMGVPDRLSEGSVRISFSPETTMSEVLTAAEVIFDSAKELKEKIYG